MASLTHTLRRNGALVGRPFSLHSPRFLLASPAVAFGIAAVGAGLAEAGRRLGLAEPGRFPASPLSLLSAATTAAVAEATASAG